MGNVIGNLTQGELVQVLGRTLIDVGERMDAGEFQDGIQVGEVASIVQRIAGDLFAEYQDE